ncbi:hypothetical protein GCM10009678_58010 [Actinomadura kijaniata]|uniref:DUF4333 domain-containing protein n=1 Tax=Actinomadura namibiensis TaxID=182080 RepID=A0A7W3LYV2_ACTNM|nr:hypothetical protein [Actinomadura namibiensis]MBA8956707.1 hypothetical protein [Actinomadura namibiensis]
MSAPEVGGRQGMVRLGVLMAALVVLVSGCDLMARISEGAYRNAVTDGVVNEMGERGIALTGRPGCAWLREGPPGTVRISCTATTRSGEPVRVEGVVEDAESDRPRERYTVTVGGREVLRQDCLGLGCGQRS